ncbi:MAG: NUDIX domain-containing protein [Candidatus Aenigmarchaeota archaeon]|nr:NUDIX domain-containing protein [Candidatus Aenigmarchaeota archaeon]
MPGGKVHLGETLEQAILREVEEETKIVPDEIYPVYVDIAKFWDKKIRIGVIYLATTEMSSIKLSDENVKFEWVLPVSSDSDNTYNKKFSFGSIPLWIEKAQEIKLAMRL